MVLEPIVVTPLDRDQLLADVKAFAETESARDLTIDAVVRAGNTAGEVLEHAAGMKADLLVIGTHGRSGFDRQDRVPVTRTATMRCRPCRSQRRTAT